MIREAPEVITPRDFLSEYRKCFRWSESLEGSPMAGLESGHRGEIVYDLIPGMRHKRRPPFNCTAASLDQQPRYPSPLREKNQVDSEKKKTSVKQGDAFILRNDERSQDRKLYAEEDALENCNFVGDVTIGNRRRHSSDDRGKKRHGEKGGLEKDNGVKENRKSKKGQEHWRSEKRRLKEMLDILEREHTRWREEQEAAGLAVPPDSTRLSEVEADTGYSIPPLPSMTLLESAEGEGRKEWNRIECPPPPRREEEQPNGERRVAKKPTRAVSAVQTRKRWDENQSEVWSPSIPPVRPMTAQVNSSFSHEVETMSPRLTEYQYAFKRPPRPNAPHMDEGTVSPFSPPVLPLQAPPLSPSQRYNQHDVKRREQQKAQESRTYSDGTDNHRKQQGAGRRFEGSDVLVHSSHEQAGSKARHHRSASQNKHEQRAVCPPLFLSDTPEVSARCIQKQSHNQHSNTVARLPSKSSFKQHANSDSATIPEPQKSQKTVAKVSAPPPKPSKEVIAEIVARRQLARKYQRRSMDTHIWWWVDAGGRCSKDTDCEDEGEWTRSGITANSCPPALALTFNSKNRGAGRPRSASPCRTYSRSGSSNYTPTPRCDSTGVGSQHPVAGTGEDYYTLPTPTGPVPEQHQGTYRLPEKDVDSEEDDEERTNSTTVTGEDTTSAAANKNAANNLPPRYANGDSSAFQPRS